MNVLEEAKKTEEWKKLMDIPTFDPDIHSPIMHHNIENYKVTSVKWGKLYGGVGNGVHHTEPFMPNLSIGYDTDDLVLKDWQAMFTAAYRIWSSKFIEWKKQGCLVFHSIEDKENHRGLIAGKKYGF